MTWSIRRGRSQGNRTQAVSGKTDFLRELRTRQGKLDPAWPLVPDGHKQMKDGPKAPRFVRNSPLSES